MVIILYKPVYEQNGVGFSIVSRRSEDLQKRVSLPNNWIKYVMSKIIGDNTKYTSSIDGNLYLQN